jgi:hypothetical protein
MSLELTSISTFGWYTDASVVDDLLPISTFGWYFDIDGAITNPDVLNFLFCIAQQMNFRFIR